MSTGRHGPVGWRLATKLRRQESAWIIELVENWLDRVMAELKQIATNTRHTLYTPFLIGRSHECSLCLPNRMVSGQHASLVWNGTGWQLQDLGSSNGTFLDRERLPARAPTAVVAGARIAFGDTTDVYELCDAGPPEPVARFSSSELISGEDNVLALPDADGGTLIVHMRAPGQWLMSRSDGSEHPVCAGEIVQAGNRTYRLFLPTRWEQTWQPDEQPMLIDQIAVRFVVTSLNRENIEVVIRHGRREIVLPARAHGPFLLELAEARIADRQRPDLPASEHGWLAVSDMCRSEHWDLTDQQLNLYLYRAREQFERAGVLNARELIQRRRLTRQIRIGVDDLEIIESLAERP